MANYYLDFVGLNTFIYEASGYDPDNQFNVVGLPSTYAINSAEETKQYTSAGNVLNPELTLNHIGYLPPGGVFSFSLVKNWLFSHELANTASYFPTLMLHRNGPYGWPTWKQLRIGQNPLTRKQIKENVFTHVQEPGPPTLIQKARKNQRHGSIKNYIEAPVISRFKPCFVKAASEDKTVSIKISMGNSTCHFNNRDLNKYYGLDDCKNPEYDQVKKLYVGEALADVYSPLDEFTKFVYAETIYPTQVYTNKSYTRQRTTFSFEWRDSRANRSNDVGNTSVSIDNGFGSVGVISQSQWPLDVSTDWATGQRAIGASSFNGMRSHTNRSDFGLLLNSYNQAAPSLHVYVNTTLLDSYMAPAASYSRKHLLLLPRLCPKME